MAEHENSNEDTDYSDGSSDSSFDEELLQDMQLNGAVGYRFEPTVDSSDASETESSESEADVPLDLVQNNRIGNTNWCTCGHCIIMPTDSESTCCKELGEVCEMIERDGLEIVCVRDHPDFDLFIMNPGVLRLAAINVSSMWRTNLPSPSTDTFYRLTAYRQFTMWVNGKLGRRNRRVVPSCVVKIIRERYPDLDGKDNYVGFMLAD